MAKFGWYYLRNLDFRFCIATVVFYLLACLFNACCKRVKNKYAQEFFVAVALVAYALMIICAIYWVGNAAVLAFRQIYG